MGVEIHGHCDARFKPLRDAFQANFDDGLEVGASVGLMVEGRMVVDLWGGLRNWEPVTPWERDTVVVTFSITKIATVLAMLVLVDRGLVDLDAPVAAYWPEFAAGGKGGVTVRDALTHQGGVPGFVPPTTFEEMHDWTGVCANLAAQDHWFGGERRVSYHANTFGHLVGEIIRRVDGRMPSRFFAEEIAAKVGIDFQMGLRTPAERARVASLAVLEPPVFPPMDAVTERVMTSTADGDWMSVARLEAELPATNGYGNGRSVARLFGLGAMRGELDGVRVFSAAVAEELWRPQAKVSKVLHLPGLMGLSLGLESEGFPAPTPTSAHWGGYGGSQGLMDPAHGVGYGWIVNNLVMRPEMADDLRWKRMWDALGEVLTGL